jgi:hypothetical protein
MKEKFQRFAIIAILSLIVLSSSGTQAQGSDTTLLPRWRKTMVVEDLIKLEGLEITVVDLARIIADQKQTIAERDTSISILERKSERQEKALTLAKLEGLTYQKEAIAWESQARKYKRQRKKTFIGGFVVAVSAGLIYNTLKR